MLHIFNICLIIFFAGFLCYGRNIIYSIFSFILLVINLTFLLIFYNVEFLSLIFLIIYIGAIAVLFLFVIFMLDLSYLHINIFFLQKASFFFRVVYLIVLIKTFFIILVIVSTFVAEDVFFYSNFNVYHSLVQSLLWTNDIDLFSYLLYTQYSNFLVLCGFILLIAMVGSVLLVSN
jgi:NADH-quinone oxidoreductase subunit J